MWNDSLKIGVDNIDEQHEMLFSKVNNLVDDIVNTGEYQKEKVISTILFLKEYAVTHFADEEVYQVMVHDANYIEHKKMHDNFIKTVLKHEKKMVESDFAHNDVSKFAGTLLAWLKYHVSDIDQKIGKDVELITKKDNHTDIICECFCDMINSMADVEKDSVVRVKEHNERFNRSITIKHSFTHEINGYVVFDYSLPFMNKLIYGLVDVPHDDGENGEIGSFEKTFLLQISTMVIENVYRHLYVNEYEVDEAEIFIIEKDQSYPDERVAFDTGLGIVEIGFSIT